jgi:hypothetical protein
MILYKHYILNPYSILTPQIINLSLNNKIFHFIPKPNAMVNQLIILDKENLFHF